MSSPTDEIKARLDLVEFIKEFVTLTPAGTNWKARCPFHQEKTPSFIVTPQRQMWHCFGCNEGGDHFTFLMKLEGIEFPEALKQLAQRTGVVLPSFNPSEVSKKDKVKKVLTAAAGWFEQQAKLPEHKRAWEYLTVARAIKPETIEAFGLGYAPDRWDALSSFLVEQKFSHEDIIDSGMVSQPPQPQSKARRIPFYDRFRSRIMFPIRESQGDVIGFSGRLLELPDAPVLDSVTQGAKYINTPQTAVYDKSRVLYGIDLAREPIRKAGFVVIVEGNMDVVSSWQAGAQNVVACSGTAFTQEHVVQLHRYAPMVALAFDEDKAGKTATLKAIDMLLGSPLKIELIRWDQEVGKDADECARKNPKLWKDAVEHHRPFLDVLWERLTSDQPVGTLSVQEKIALIIFPFLKKLQRPLERQFWVKRIAESFGYTQVKVEEMIEKSGKPEPRPRVPASALAGLPVSVAHKPNRLTLEERFLGLCSLTPEAFSSIINAISPEMFSQSECREIYTTMILSSTQANTGKDAERSVMPVNTTRIIVAASQLYEGLDANQRTREVFSLSHQLERRAYQQQLRLLQEEIRSVEKTASSEVVTALMHKVQELNKTIAQFSDAS